MHRLSLFAALLFAALVLAALSVAADPLPSWKDGPAKQAITGFVTDVTKAGGKDFVPPAQRIAVFDNDGTLWVEQPMYTQLAFVLDRVKTLAPTHPEWQAQQPFKAALEGDLATLGEAGLEGLMQLLMANEGHPLPLERVTGHVWGYRGVGDRQLLKQLVHRLRQKIERDPGNPEYVVTVAGIGYRFSGQGRRAEA